MADVSKIKLPDDSVLNIKDARIPGVDTTPTSGSSNLITSGGVYDSVNEISLVAAAALNELNDRVSDLEDAVEANGSSTVGTLNTTATTAQLTNASESLSGNITLHKIAKTGTYSDLINAPTIILSYTVSNVMEPTAIELTGAYTSAASAISAGKIPIVVLSDGSSVLPLQMTYNTSVEIYFDAYNGGGQVYELVLKSDGTVSAYTDVLQTTNNLVTSISSSSTNSQYPSAKCVYDAIPDAVTANPTVPSGTTPTTLSSLKVGNNYYDISSGGSVGTLITNNTTAQTASASESFANTINLHKIAKTGTYSDLIGTPTISSNVATDKADNTKVAGAKATYDEVHPAVVSSQPAGGFAPNILYDLGTITGTVTFTMASPTDATIINHYYWTFETSSTAPTITWPAGITSWYGGSAPTIAASKHYEVSVLDGVGCFMEV